MAQKKSRRKIPKVRIARPSGRLFQIRYTCPDKGQEIRLSVGSRDESEAEDLKADVEAKLQLGMEIKSIDANLTGPEMDWDDFREQYRTLHLTGVRENTAIHSESRLDLAERILKPKTLGDVADQHELHKLQAQLLAGVHSRRKKPRSPHTVRSHMNTVLAALNWAHLQNWLPNPPKIQKIKTSKQKAMKGRPITRQEFQLMLDATASVVGEEVADSWKYVLRGLWESALRLDELMHVSWDIPGTIRPIWREGQLPVLEIPASMQKNNTDESIPLMPWLEAMLLKTPLEKRTGWIFEPESLQLKLGRKPGKHRPATEWVGRIISRIGKAADVIVEVPNARTGKPTKYATAHDLRRSCGERLRNAGIPPLVICRVMRHSSWETTQKHYAPGNIQKDAEVLRDTLGKSTTQGKGE
jgi:integrase